MYVKFMNDKSQGKFTAACYCSGCVFLSPAGPLYHTEGWFPVVVLEFLVGDVGDTMAAKNTHCY